MTATLDDEVGVEELLDEVDALLGFGLGVLTACQINLFPLLTHFKEAVADLVTVPTFAHVLPTDFAVEAEKAKGAEAMAAENSAATSMGEAFLRVIRKTVLPSEC